MDDHAREPEGRGRETEGHGAAALDYHYRETVRLAAICDAYARDAFADFKLLSALGAIAAWKPFHDALGLAGRSGGQEGLLFGFLAIVVVLGAIGIMNLQKQLIVGFYLEELEHFETALRALLRCENAATFRVAANWRRVGARRQRRLGRLFYVLFYLAVALPALVLGAQEGRPEGLQYLGAATVVTVIHFTAVLVVHGPRRAAPPADGTAPRG